MLNCFLSHRKTVGYGKEVSMQDREQARLEWLNRLQQPQLQYLTTSPNNAVEFLVRPRDQILVGGSLMFREQQDDPTSGFVKFAVNGEEPGLVSPECRSGAFVQKQPLLKAASRLPSTVEAAEIHENVSGVEGKGKDVTMMKMEFTTKRKVEFVVAQEWKDKRIKRDAEGVEPVVDEKSSGETPADFSKENSKAREFQKPDYIHVRARRGQATDSHSLAERARREKINKKMKTLQDLVPGCSRIVGRAGVLDEIINYVQSLQRQVEFLSMKLAALNPKVDLNPEEKAQSFPTSETNLPKIYNVEFN